MTFAITLALCGAVGTSGAEARAPLLVGLQDDSVFVHPPFAFGGIEAQALMPAATGYRWATALGVRVLRIAIHWAAVMPGGTAGEQHWSYYDTAITAARERGFVVQVELSGPAPAFATAHHRVGVNRPNATAFARFAALAAARYRGEVATYSIWNEPNWPSQLRPVRDAPGIYRRLYQGGYAAIKRADPAARVLIGELAPLGPPEKGDPPLRFLRQLTCQAGAPRTRARARRRTRPACRPLLADGFALHPYTLRWPPGFPGNGPDDVTTGSLARLVRSLDKLARAGALSTPAGRPLDVYLTEYGWYANYPRIPEARRAAYIAKSFTLALEQPRVKEIVWYELASPPTGVKRVWDTALLKPDDQAGPAFQSLSSWIHSAVTARLALPGGYERGGDPSS